MIRLLEKIHENIKCSVDYWYYCLAAICSLEILNLTFTSQFASYQLTTFLSILLVSFAIYYIGAVADFRHKEFILCLENNQHDIKMRVENLESHNNEILKKLLDDISEKHSIILTQNEEIGLKLKTELLEKIDMSNVTTRKELKTLSESTNNRFEMFDNNLNKKADTLLKGINGNLAILKNIEKNNESENKNVSSMLSSVIKTNEKIEKDIKNFALQNGDISNAIERLENQTAMLNALVALLSPIKNANKRVDEGNSGFSNGKYSSETIEDEENKIKVINFYSNDIMVYSEMNQDGKKVFSADYDSNGKVLSSKNYDKSGHVATELIYFPNGQVKTRKEKTLANGENHIKVTNFDIKNNKKS